jgi:serine/threonine-protein kinase
MKTCEQCHLRYPNESTFCFVDGKPLVFLKDPRVGQTIGGRYVIEEILGEGGMATVYRARHKLVDKPCAVKIMNPGLSRDPVVRERFRREAKSAQKLAHPNIIEIFDQGDTDDGTAYLVMELLVGEALAQTIARGALPVERALPITVQIARALARAHDFDVIHRDLKPENIFICKRDDGTDLVKLLDFGIARSLQDARLTGAGEVFGTPQYMAPERITSIDAAAPSDLYAVGVIFFEMLTGQLPFVANDIPTLFLKHLKEPPPRLRALAPAASASLEKLVTSLMAKDPNGRPVDAHKMHSELLAICRELSIPIPPEPEAEMPSSRSPSPTLPPVALDQWARRASLFEQMLSRAFPQSAPAELVRLLADIHRLVEKTSTLRAESVRHQRKLDTLEARGKDGRQRFGFAVDALGIDASRAREVARDARAGLPALSKVVAQAKEEMLRCQREIMLWEGRSALAEPYDELREAYSAAADTVNRWLVGRRKERRAEEHAEGRDREVADLEFQIGELRAGLAKLEQEVESEQGECERRIAELDKEGEGLQVELLALASRFCAPLRRRPELGELFHELEADAVAA